MHSFSHYALRIDLPNAGFAVLLRPRYCVPHMANNYSVVYSDPGKLSPYMDVLNAREHPPTLADKQKEALKGLRRAKTQFEGVRKIIDPHETTLETGPASVFLNYDAVRAMLLGRDRMAEFPDIRFSDGITRTSALITQGAPFVPLTVSAQRADLFHQTVGSAKLPESVAAFLASDDESRHAAQAYRQKNRSAPACE